MFPQLPEDVIPSLRVRNVDIQNYFKVYSGCQTIQESGPAEIIPAGPNFLFSYILLKELRSHFHTADVGVDGKISVRIIDLIEQSEKLFFLCL